MLDYASQTQGQDLNHLRRFAAYQDRDTIGLDSAARQNLEIVSSLRQDDGPTLLSVLDHCQTSAGGRMLRRWLLAPPSNPAESTARHEKISALLGHGADKISSLLDGLPDLERIASRIALLSARPRELAALRDCRSAITELRQTLTSADLVDAFGSTCESLALPSSTHDRLEAALAEEPSALARDGGVIRAGFECAVR